MEIFEAIGAGAAAGLSPLVAIAAVVLFAAAHLGVDPETGDVGWVASAAIVAVAVVILVQSFLMIVAKGGVRVRIAADRPSLLPLNLSLAVAVGALAGAIVFNAEGNDAVVGAILGAMPAALVALAANGLLSGVVRRLESRREAAAAKGTGAPPAPDSSERRVLATAVDVVTVAVVAVSLAAPPLGLLLPVLAILVLIGRRRREAKKHAGLRVLR